MHPARPMGGYACCRRFCLVGLLVAAGDLGAQEPILRRADNAPRWGENPRLVEEVRIGSLVGAEEYSFGSVGGVGVLNDGSVWVGDSQRHAILRYSAEGAFLGQVGREGEGPGEFRYPSALRVMDGGRVFVWDPGLVRISEFSSEGAFLSSFSPPTHMVGGRFEEFEVDSEGYLYLIALTQPEVTGATGQEQLLALSRQRRRSLWLKMDQAGVVLDSIFLLPRRPEGTVDAVWTQTQWSPLGYRVTARNDEYALTLELRDQPVQIRRDWTAVPYERAERSAKQRLEEVFAGRNSRPVRDVPSTKLPFSTFHIDSQGRLWVERHVPGIHVRETDGERARREEACEFFGRPREECDKGIREWHEPKTFDVIDPSGLFLGQITLPNRQSELAFCQDDLLWVVERGAYGEEYIVRYRIAPPS